MELDIGDRKQLVIWASDCAERVLPLFEEHYPEDDRPRKAIEAARSWAAGTLRISDARKFAFAAHAAARDATRPESIAAARAAGHAAATAHVPTHAKYAASYAAKSTEDPEAEASWQQERIPDHLRSIL